MDLFGFSGFANFQKSFISGPLRFRRRFRPPKQILDYYFVDFPRRENCRIFRIFRFSSICRNPDRLPIVCIFSICSCPEISNYGIFRFCDFPEIENECTSGFSLITFLKKSQISGCRSFLASLNLQTILQVSPVFTFLIDPERYVAM